MDPGKPGHCRPVAEGPESAAALEGPHQCSHGSCRKAGAPGSKVPTAHKYQHVWRQSGSDPDLGLAGHKGGCKAQTENQGLRQPNRQVHDPGTRQTTGTENWIRTGM